MFWSFFICWIFEEEDSYHNYSAGVYWVASCIAWSPFYQFSNPKARNCPIFYYLSLYLLVYLYILELYLRRKKKERKKNQWRICIANQLVFYSPTRCNLSHSKCIHLIFYNKYVGKKKKRKEGSRDPNRSCEKLIKWTWFKAKINTLNS